MDQTIRLDAKKRESAFCEEKIYPLRRGERNNVVLTVQVRADGAPYDLTGKEARLVGTAADGKLVGPCALEVSDAKAGTGSLTLPASMCSAVGTTHAYIEIREGDTLLETTGGFACKVLECADMDAEQAEEYKPLIAEVREATDAAIKAAAKAVTDTQAAIADVKATEAKLYPAAENILVRSETGAVAHVEDAFAGASLRKITIEGACKQDGIPSPDAPKPIAVIENPTVKIVGRNHAHIAAGMPRADCDTDFDNATKRVIPPGTYIEGLTFNNYMSPNNISGLKIADGGIGFDTIESAYGVGVGVDLASGATYIDSVANYHSFYDRDGTFLKYAEGRQFQVPDDAVYSVAIFRPEVSGHFSESDISITHVADNGAYAPYTSQTLTFALPAEHPYLAKLPDGTADEIVVDKEGNVELVARVSKVIPKDNDRLNFGAGTDTDAPYVSFPVIGIASKTGILSNGYQTSNWTNKSGYIYCPNGTDLAIRDGRFTSKEKAIELLDGVVVYIAVEPTRYSLGKIEMPKAQDSIVNAWTDAEVTPNTSISYVRDVNIVVANIESAIASITEG